MPELANLFPDGDPRQMPFVDITAAEARSGCTFNISVPRRIRCVRCGASGAEPSAPDSPCGACDGEGFRTEEELVTVTIPPDTPPGTVLTLRGQGDDHRDPDRGRGDLQVGVRIDGVFQPAVQAPLPAAQAKVTWIALAVAMGLLAAAVAVVVLMSSSGP